MTKLLVALVCVSICALTMSANTRMSDTTTKNPGTMSMATPKYQASNIKEDDDFDMEAIMNDCNETFRIEIAYLESLNDTGSFIDETDKTPKCFIRCVLENIGVMSVDDGMFNPEKAAVLFAGERNGKPMEDLGEFTEICADRRESCKCDRAYKFMRCLMTMEIEKYESTQ